MKIMATSEKGLSQFSNNDTELSPRPVRYPELYKGAPLTILNTKKVKIAAGRLVAFSSYELRIERLPGELVLPILQKGTVVSVQGYTDDTEPFELQCTVKKSSKLILTVDNLTLVDCNSRRAYFRQAIGRPAEVFEPESAYDGIPQKCTLKNISMNGAGISSSYRYVPGQELRLRVELYRKAGCISFPCQVVWVKKMDSNQYEYGLLFAQLSANKARYLEEDIRAVQAIEKRQAKR